MDKLNISKNKSEWTIEDTKTLYHIDHWGGGYFSINEQGHLAVLPEKNQVGPSIDIMEIISEINEQGISLPAVIRFHDILRNQVVSINKTFRKVIEEAQFQGQYVGVYPIKVNQMREVVEEIIDAGSDYNFGLEAGSRTELLSVLAFNTNEDALTILNGHKDENCLRLALLGRKLDRSVIIVVEKYSELLDTIRLAEEMNVEPMIGLRTRLSARGTGKWAESGGERAKFGLTIAELLQAVNLMKQKGKESWIKLFHFHIGSQITEIRTIKDAITEGTRIYAKLCKLGIPIEYFDVGGGLGVDYDGSKSTLDSSTNYSLNDYAEDVVYIVKQICDLEGVAHPNIVTESGRAITAIHSCVIFKAFDSIDTTSTDYPLSIISNDSDRHIIVTNMIELWEELDRTNFQETYNDAIQAKEECINAFKLGILSLEERGAIEVLFWKICKKINLIIQSVDFVPDELKELDNLLSQQYLCNCSFFQAVPDAWAIQQLFPILPLSRLNEKPTVLGTLSDITCDSDGKIDRFIHHHSTPGALPLHEIHEGQDYYLGTFLTGAYQDVMGDMHNMFGKLNEVHIFCDDEDPADFYVEEVISGHTSSEVLTDMQYNPIGMARTVKKFLNRQVSSGKIAPKEGVKLADFYEQCLGSYTYLSR